MDILQEILKFLFSFLSLLFQFSVLIESTPSWWFAHGYNFGIVLIISFLLYTVRLMIEVSLMRVGFSFAERVTLLLLNFLPTQALNRLTSLTHGSDIKKERYIKFFRDLGYFGLVLAGFIAVPVLGMIGPTIYNLERWHKPWYRFDNLAFACLLGGGLIKMYFAVVVCSKL